MTSDSGCVITYNGEIYNYIELREELGHESFRTQSDTEVILRAYERWGDGCVERLRGMFAFAIWDPRKNSLFVARDRFGIKPFYFTEQAGSFYFASEIKALCPFLPAVRTHLPALHDYFSFQFCLGQKTLFEGVHQLPPAHCGVVRTGRSATVSSLLGSAVQLGLAPYRKILRRPDARTIGRLSPPTHAQ